MRNLNHANLLRVYAACSDARTPCLVTELMIGSLDQLLWGAQVGDVCCCCCCGCRGQPSSPSLRVVAGHKRSRMPLPPSPHQCQGCLEI
jgi:hypothetical protein